MLNHSDGQGPGGLRQGTKLALIAAACLLAVAAYFFVSPTNFVGKDGSLFGCGSPMSPNSERLAKGQCNIVEGVAMHKAVLFLALAVLTAGLGYLLFGADSTPRAARSRDRYDEDEDERYADADIRDEGPRDGRIRHERTRDERIRDERIRDERIRDERIRDERSGRQVPKRRSRLGDEDDAPVRRSSLVDDDEAAPAPVRRSRLGDEDAARESTLAARKVRTRLSDDDDDESPRRRVSDDESRERRRASRYEDDAFDGVRD